MHDVHNARTCTSKQECFPVGCIPSAAVAVGVGGVCPGSVCPGVCVSQYALGRGVSAPVHAGIHPPVNRMTDRRM